MKYKYYVVTAEIDPGFTKPIIEDDVIQERLNAIGEKGWELVSVVPNAGYKGHLCSCTFYFKKPVEDDKK